MAAYRAFKKYLSKDSQQLLIPARESFQLHAGLTSEDFRLKVYLSVAQTLIERAGEVRDMSFSMENSDALNAWLNDPLLAHVEGGFNIAGWGLKLGKPPVANDSAGFEREGFINVVQSWLQNIFPSYGSGGVVCVIDNLEILESASAARKTLEALRDTLFNQQGLRWVFCGASGILTGVTASARLQDYLLPLVELKPLAADDLGDVLEARINEYVPAGKEFYLPLGTTQLKNLYWVVNYNLRGLLSQADAYCEWIVGLGDQKRPVSEEDKDSMFDNWLQATTKRNYDKARTQVEKDAWEILDVTFGSALKGSFTAANFSYIKSNSFLTISQETIAKHVSKLVTQGYLSASFDEDTIGSGKKIATRYDVTTKACLAHYGRYLSKETHAIEPAIWESGGRLLRGNAE